MGLYKGGSEMLEVILTIVVILGWGTAMVRAYWNNGGLKDFKKSFKKVLDKIHWM